MNYVEDESVKLDTFLKEFIEMTWSWSEIYVYS